MRLIVYDTEVFCEDWLVVLKDWRPANTVVHNDTEELTIDRIDNNGMLGKTRR